jgi:hypothetical protein
LRRRAVPIAKPARRIEVTEAVGKSVELFSIEYPDQDHGVGAVTVRFTDGTEVWVDLKPLVAVRPAVYACVQGDYECLKEYGTEILHPLDSEMVDDVVIRKAENS